MPIQEENGMEFEPVPIDNKVFFLSSDFKR